MKRSQTRGLTAALMAGAFAVLAALPVDAQSAPSSGTTALSGSGLRSDADRYNPVHRDTFKQACLKYEAIATAHLSNPSIFDHIVSIANSCPQMIKVHICYEKSDDHCRDVALTGGQRTETVLGIFPSRNFTYQTKERFDTSPGMPY